MKVVHTLGWYFPESSGGTEVYVEALARNLSAFGVRSVIAAATAYEPVQYTWKGVDVFRYPVPEPTREEIAAPGTPPRFEQFESWLRAQNADVYHQHSWMRACGGSHLDLATRLGLRTVLTVHLPTVVCLRGTMMLDGHAPCDGRIDLQRCTRCWGQARGIPDGVSQLQARFPGASAALGGVLPTSRVRTALLTPALVTRRQHDVIDLAGKADRIVPVCRWLYEALASNGVPREKLVYCAQGIEPSPRPPQTHDDDNDEARPLRVGFLGRWERVKGIHVLVDAFRALPPDVLAELIVHGLPSDLRYEREVRALAEGDRRIRIEGSVDRTELHAALARFDVLAVPSQWMETGPLVVLEAFAAGIPVIGSDLGGIRELVEPGTNGMLVPAGDVTSWCQAIATFARTPRALRPGRSMQAPRSSREVAGEMALLYQSMLGEGRTIGVNDARGSGVALGV